MTNPSIFQEIKEVIDDINSEVNAEEVEDPDAAEIIKNLTKDGGGIEVIGDKFEPVHEDVTEVKSRVEDEYTETYGLDGSTTKDLGFNNGLIVSIAVAAAGVASSERVEGVSEKGTVSIVAYFDENPIDIDPSSGEDKKVYFNQFPRVTNLSSDLPNWINSIARTNAEGKHFEWISTETTGPLFIDGPMLPPDLLIWSAYGKEGTVERTPMEDWSDMIYDVLQSYVRGIENTIVKGNPIYGVQKTTSSTRVLDALVEKNPELTRREMPYTDDGTLFNSALQNDMDGASISYTPWYVEHEFEVGRTTGRVTPFKNNKNIDLSLGSYEDYKRAFFFAKPPTQTTVYRIGVPKMLLNTHDRDTLRDIALSEMIKQFKEPLPVVVADEKVRIPRHVRDDFRRLISSESHKDKNERRGFK